MLGTVVIGVIFTDIKGFPKSEYAHQGRTLGGVEYVHGGVSRNVAENIAVSGLPVTFLSMTDSDGIGREAVERLDRCGVNTEFILPAEQNGIGKWMVILDEKGDIAAQISSPPDMKPLADFVEVYGNAFVQDAEQIVLELDIGSETVARVLDLAERYGKKVYPVVGDLKALLSNRDLICRTDCLVCNCEELAALVDPSIGSLPPQQLCGCLAELIESVSFPSTVVTFGEEGCVYYDKATKCVGMLPAEKTAVVDDSGAGDAFRAGVFMGLSNGFSLKNASMLGTSLAALSLSSSGRCCPANSLPAEFLRKMSMNGKK